MVEYFPALARRMDVLRPLDVTGKLGAFDVLATVKGGGSTGLAAPCASHRSLKEHGSAVSLRQVLDARLHHHV